MKRATKYNYQQQIIAAGRSMHSTMVSQRGFWIGAEIRWLRSILHAGIKKKKTEKYGFYMQEIMTEHIPKKLQL